LSALQSMSEILLFLRRLGGVADNKEFLQSSFGCYSFNVVLIRKVEEKEIG
jgi:hypothetical protein